MATAVADLTSLLEGVPPGAWVAISESENRVIAYGADAQDVLRIAKEQGIEMPLITRVPDEVSAMFF